MYLRIQASQVSANLTVSDSFPPCCALAVRLRRRCARCVRCRSCYGECVSVSVVRAHMYCTYLCFEIYAVYSLLAPSSPNDCVNGTVSTLIAARPIELTSVRCVRRRLRRPRHRDRARGDGDNGTQTAAMHAHAPVDETRSVATRCASCVVRRAPRGESRGRSRRGRRGRSTDSHRPPPQAFIPPAARLDAARTARKSYCLRTDHAPRTDQRPAAAVAHPRGSASHPRDAPCRNRRTPTAPSCQARRHGVRVEATGAWNNGRTCTMRTPACIRRGECGGGGDVLASVDRVPHAFLHRFPPYLATVDYAIWTCIRCASPSVNARELRRQL